MSMLAGTSWQRAIRNKRGQIVTRRRAEATNELRITISEPLMTISTQPTMISQPVAIRTVTTEAFWRGRIRAANVARRLCRAKKQAQRGCNRMTKRPPIGSTCNQAGMTAKRRPVTAKALPMIARRQPATGKQRSVTAPTLPRRHIGRSRRSNR